MNVLITGGGRRIGAAIATKLARQGWTPIVHYRHSQAQAQALAGAIREFAECHVIGADLANRAEAARLIPDCVARFGAVAALVNNASSFHHDSAATLECWDQNVATNLHAPLMLARDFAAARGDGGGAIVNMLDQKIANPNPDFFSYSVAKIALAGATQMLAMAFGGRIRVNGVAPGITLISGKQTASGFARAWSSPPLGRSSTPEELAEAVSFLLATPAVNGQILYLDGGESLAGRARDVAFEVV